MTALQITIDLDRNPWLDVEDHGEATVTRIGFSPNGMRPMVAILLVDDEGRVILARMSYPLFRTAARVFAVTPTALLIDDEEDE